MTVEEAIEARHSVRAYTDKKIEGETLDALRKEIADVNEESGLNVQLVVNEEKAFGGAMAKYGNFKNVKNYIALVGKKGEDLSETAGYYGERIVLFAQTLGLNTCWVGLSYSKKHTLCKIDKGEKLVCVLAIGYGVTQGVPHKSKPIEKVSKVVGSEMVPDWFEKGVKAALLAPTAMNQQKFRIVLDGNEVKFLPGTGFYTKVDSGIARYHFAVASEYFNDHII